MSGMFCRHNRPTNKCPICSREQEQRLREQAPVRYVTVRKPGATSTPRSRGSSSGGSGAAKTNPKRLVTRKLARAADDGYRNPLVPGLKATADAERLAGALTMAVARLEPPGPYAYIGEIEDPEQATWLAFLTALAPKLREQIEETRPVWGEDPQLPASKAKTIAATRPGSSARARRTRPS